MESRMALGRKSEKRVQREGVERRQDFSGAHLWSKVNGTCRIALSQLIDGRGYKPWLLPTRTVLAGSATPFPGWFFSEGLALFYTVLLSFSVFLPSETILFIILLNYFLFSFCSTLGFICVF